MTASEDPWALPSTRAFLEEIEALSLNGGGFVRGGVSMPRGSELAIARRLSERDAHVEKILVDETIEPAAAVAKAFGEPPDAKQLAQSKKLANNIALVTLGAGEAQTSPRWDRFLSRFLAARPTDADGLSILVIGPESVTGPWRAPSVAWNGRLRRLDVTIWADVHAPLRRSAPLAALATALAVELCGWRLDLAAELARARREDLLNPEGWLAARHGDDRMPSCRLDDEEMACPLSLLEDGEVDALRRRIWRAQLLVLFPWIEERRQVVVTRHRRRLRVDERQRDLGVRDVDGLEFGAIAHQLKAIVGPHEAERMWRLARIRNEIAHRRPARRDDLDQALRDGDG